MAIDVVLAVAQVEALEPLQVKLAAALLSTPVLVFLLALRR